MASVGGVVDVDAKMDRRMRKWFRNRAIFFFFFGGGIWVVGATVPVVLAFWYRTCLEFFMSGVMEINWYLLGGEVYYIYMTMVYF